MTGVLVRYKKMEKRLQAIESHARVRDGQPEGRTLECGRAGPQVPGWKPLEPARREGFNVADPLKCRYHRFTCDAWSNAPNTF